MDPGLPLFFDAGIPDAGIPDPVFPTRGAGRGGSARPPVTDARPA